MNNETLNQVFSSTANSIRTKLGSSDKITPTDFASQISTIQADVITVENISDIDTTKLDPNKRYLVFKENWSNIDNDFDGNCEVKLPLEYKASSSSGHASIQCPFYLISVNFTYLPIRKTLSVKYYFGNDSTTIASYTYNSDDDTFYINDYTTEPVIFCEGYVKGGYNSGASDSLEFLKYHKSNTYLGTYIPKFEYYFPVKSNLNNTYKWFGGGADARNTNGKHDGFTPILMWDFETDEDNRLISFKFWSIRTTDKLVAYKSNNKLHIKNLTSSEQLLGMPCKSEFINGTFVKTEYTYWRVSANSDIEISDVDLSGNEFIYVGYEDASGIIYNDVNKSSIFLSAKQIGDIMPGGYLEKLIENS